MKKLTIWAILSTWLLYVLVPLLYRGVYGKYPENLNSLGYLPDAYQTRAAIIVTAVLFAGMLLIAVLPGGKRPLVDTVEGSAAYYYATLAVYILLALAAGVRDYSNALTGNLNGTLMAYYTMFFYPVALFVITLFCVRRKGSLLLLVGSYLLQTLLTHSRSGAVYLGLFLVGFALTVEGSGRMRRFGKRTAALARRYKKQIGLLVLGLILISPFLYVYATRSRESVASNAAHSALEVIAARCSCLDEAGLALYQKDAGLWRADIFREKYGLLHQLGCIVDSILPGSLFGGDVDPNQYFRAAVGYLSAENAARYYSSTNLMLPVYMVLKYGLWGGMLLSTALIAGFYLAVSRMKSPVWQVVLTMLLLREILYFFDWVMIWRVFQRTALTVLVYELVRRLFGAGGSRARLRR